MTRRIAALALIVAVLALVRPVVAHHSFAAQYDRNKPITLTGAVTKMEWFNPHIYFYLDVKDAADVATNWAIEGGAPNTLYRAGWRRDSVKFGDVVTVHGFLARDGTKLVNMQRAVLADGRTVFGGQQQ
jgi:uncharacterized protein DUF6152